MAGVPGDRFVAITPILLSGSGRPRVQRRCISVCATLCGTAFCGSGAARVLPDRAVCLGGSGMDWDHPVPSPVFEIGRGSDPGRRCPVCFPQFREYRSRIPHSVVCHPLHSACGLGNLSVLARFSQGYIRWQGRWNDRGGSPSSHLLHKSLRRLVFALLSVTERGGEWRVGSAALAWVGPRTPHSVESRHLEGGGALSGAQRCLLRSIRDDLWSGPWAIWGAPLFGDGQHAAIAHRLCERGPHELAVGPGAMRWPRFTTAGA